MRLLVFSAVQRHLVEMARYIIYRYVSLYKEYFKVGIKCATRPLLLHIILMHHYFALFAYVFFHHHLPVSPFFYSVAQFAHQQREAEAGSCVGCPW